MTAWVTINCGYSAESKVFLSMNSAERLHNGITGTGLRKGPGEESEKWEHSNLADPP